MATGQELAQQSVIRRLLTNPGDDLYASEYGAGLPLQIGQPAHDERLRATILRNLRLEVRVDQAKPITVTVQTDPATSQTYARIQYFDRITGDQSALTLPLGVANDPSAS